MSQKGLLDYLNTGMQSPMFLGGAALMSGDGMSGAMRGMQAGHRFSDQQRQREEQQQRNTAFEQMTSDPSKLPGINPVVANLARMMGPNAGAPMIANAIPKPINPLDDEYRRAQIEKLRSGTNSQPKQRIVKGKDGYQYFADTQERVLPEITNGPTDDKSANIEGGLSNLAKLPSQYGDWNFETSVGPVQGDDSGSWMTTGISRALGSLGNVFSNAAPTEIRAKIAGDTEALAASIKPLIRKPGEGPWTDSDQARLVSIVGDLAQSNDKDEYFRRLNAVRDRINANFGMQLPEVVNPENKKPQAQAQAVNAPQVGRVQDGHVFLGGNPADPSSWSAVR